MEKLSQTQRQQAWVSTRKQQHQPPAPVETAISGKTELNCEDTNAEVFFSGQQVDIELAKQLCAACLKRLACLELALKHNEYGVWGGLTKSEREALKRQRNA